MTRRLYPKQVQEYQQVLGFVGSASLLIALARVFGDAGEPFLSIVGWFAAVAVSFVALVDYLHRGYGRGVFVWSAPAFGVGLAWLFSIFERVLPSSGLVPACLLALVPLCIYGYWAVTRHVWEPYVAAGAAGILAGSLALHWISTAVAAIGFGILTLLSVVFLGVLLGELNAIERGWAGQD